MLPALKWCEQNGISPGNYYAHLRKFREEMLTKRQFVPVENAAPADEIQIESGEIRVTLPCEASPKQVLAVNNGAEGAGLPSDGIYRDLWREIDGVAELVEGKLPLKLYSKVPFLFCGRKWDRLKGHGIIIFTNIKWKKGDKVCRSLVE